MQDKPYSVSEISSIVKSIFQSNPEFVNIAVQGEISNLSNSNASGHVYFALKDKKAILKCNFFQNSYRLYSGKPLSNGMEVIVLGKLSIYELQSQYNLTISSLTELGEGEIYRKIALLKRKLLEEGIFDANRKKPLPKYPKILGVATSPTGAAIDDIIKNVKEINPFIDILVAPCQVQGTDAPNSIVEAIKMLNDPKWNVDVIIAGRGGGSFEDLMAFNDEKVVRAYAGSRVPIVSAVGHEIDSSLSDYAADQFTSTPTEAARLVVPNSQIVLDQLNDIQIRMKKALLNRKKFQTEKLKSIVSRNIFQNPTVLMESPYRRLDEITNSLVQFGKKFLSSNREKLYFSDKISLYFEAQKMKKFTKLDILKERLVNFSPLGTLKRGYAVMRDNQKRIIKSIEDLDLSQEAEVLVLDGKYFVKVLSKAGNK